MRMRLMTFGQGDQGERVQPVPDPAFLHDEHRVGFELNVAAGLAGLQPTIGKTIPTTSISLQAGSFLER
jgi:hypothetical protein